MGVARFPTVDSYGARIFHVQAALEAPRISMGRMYQAVVFNSGGAANKGCRGGFQGPPETFRMTTFTAPFWVINRVWRMIFSVGIDD